MNNIDLTVIMPFYNEEQNVEQTVNNWRDHLKSLKINFQLVCYNDGSKDQTLQKLQDMKKLAPELVVIDQENKGHGPSILRGYQNYFQSPWIFQTDSDNELPAQYFHLLWNQRDQYDFLIAIRENRQSPKIRQIITMTSRLIVKIFYGSKVYDVNAPYRLIKNSFLTQFIYKIPSDTFAPNIIISGMASLANLRILNQNVPHTPRQHGEVSIKKWKLLRACMTSFWQVIKFRFSVSHNIFQKTL